MRTRAVSLLAVFLMSVLAGCATAKGLAEDTENLARGMKKTISEQSK